MIYFNARHFENILNYAVGSICTTANVLISVSDIELGIKLIAVLPASIYMCLKIYRDFIRKKK